MKRCGFRKKWQTIEVVGSEYKVARRARRPIYDEQSNVAVTCGTGIITDIIIGENKTALEFRVFFLRFASQKE